MGLVKVPFGRLARSMPRTSNVAIEALAELVVRQTAAEGIRSCTAFCRRCSTNADAIETDRCRS